MKRRQVLQFGLGPLGAAAVGLLLVPITAWLFSSEDIGRISLLLIVSNIFTIVFSLGLDQAYVREFHHRVIEGRDRLFREAVLPGFLVLSSFCVFQLLVFPDIVSKLIFGFESKESSVLIVAFIIAGFLSRFLSLILRMREKGFLFSLSQVIPKLFMLGMISIYMLAKVDMSFYKLLYVNVGASLSTVLYYIWVTRKQLLSACRCKINRSDLVQMLRFGLPLAAGGVASWGLSSSDRAFLSIYSTLADLGMYAVAVNIALSVGIISSVFNIVWAPTVYKWAAAGEDTAKIDIITEHMLAIIVFVLVGVSLFSRIIVLFLPSEYGDVQFIIGLCMAAPLFYTLSETTAVGIGLARKSIYSLWSSFIAASVVVVMCYTLVPALGAKGAAVSTGLAFWVFLFARTEFSSKVWRSVPRRKLYFTTMSVLALSIGFSLYGAENSLLWTFIWGGLGGVMVALFRKSLIAGLAEGVLIYRHLRKM